MNSKKLTVGVYTLSVVLLLVAVGAWYLGPLLAGRMAYAVATSQAAAAREELKELNARETVSPLFRKVADLVKPAVVEVRVTKRIQEDVPDFEDLFPRFFGDPTPGPRRGAPAPQHREFMARGLGSGVVVNKDQGYVLTNYHVVAGADTVEVVLADERKMEAEWVRTDPQTDLAIVKIKPERLFEAPLGDSDKMEVGDWVLAIGSPEGLPQTVTSGIVSAKGRTRAELRATHLYQSFIQTDAAINHGNSGGPLVNMMGEVVGITTAIVSRTGVNEGIGLSIPSNMAKYVMKQLVDGGKVTRGYIGVRFQEVDEKLAKSFNLPSTKGALIVDVAADGPAAKAGLKGGDFVTSVNGKAIADGNELRNMVAQLTAGEKIAIEYYRDGTKHTGEIAVGTQPEDMAAAFSDSGGTGTNSHGTANVKGYGLRVATLDDATAKQLGYRKSTRGVVVTDVDSKSDAAEQGLEAGMVITDVDGKPVATAEEFSKAIAGKTKGIRLKVVDPQGGAQYVVVTPMKAKGSTQGAP